MKLQHINGGTNQANSANNTKAHDNSFECMLKNQIKNDNPKEDIDTQSRPVSSAEQAESAKHLTSYNIKQANIVGLKALAKDSFSDIGTQILNEIESLCEDETGENIDMKLLDELLELYKNTQKQSYKKEEIR